MLPCEALVRSVRLAIAEAHGPSHDSGSVTSARLADPAIMTLRCAIFCGLLASMVGCSVSGAGPDLPMISPTVRAATPAGLRAAAARQLAAGFEAVLPASELRERFFSGTGPTDLMTLLGEIDQRLAGSTRSAATRRASTRRRCRTRSRRPGRRSNWSPSATSGSSIRCPAIRHSCSSACATA